MCQVRFIGCLHLGHEWMAKRRGFNDSFHHDEWLIQQWNSVVNKKDLTYILGDVTMETAKFYYQLDRLNGRKIVVLGNHDLPKHSRELLQYVEFVAGMIDYKGYCLTHAPIHPNEVHFYHGNIHAHIHENELHELMVKNKYNDEDSLLSPTKYKYFNVDAERVGFKPRKLEVLTT